jgi:hemoglobin
MEHKDHCDKGHCEKGTCDKAACEKGHCEKGTCDKAACEKGQCEKTACEKTGDKQETCPHAAKFKSLYDKYGGEDTIASVVDQFYKKVLADPRVKDFFNKTDMTKQRRHQTNFICFALGGPKKYTGKNMRDAHAGMGLTDVHFDAIVELLSATLLENGVTKEDVTTIQGVIEPLRNDVLCR